MQKVSPDNVDSVSPGLRIVFASRDMRDIAGEIARLPAGGASAGLGSAGVIANLSLPAMAPGEYTEIVGNESMLAVCMGFSRTDDPSRKKVVAGSPHNSQPEAAQ